MKEIYNQLFVFSNAEPTDRCIECLIQNYLHTGEKIGEISYRSGCYVIGMVPDDANNFNQVVISSTGEGIIMIETCIDIEKSIGNYNGPSRQTVDTSGNNMWRHVSYDRVIKVQDYLDDPRYRGSDADKITMIMKMTP